MLLNLKIKLLPFSKIIIKRLSKSINNKSGIYDYNFYYYYL